jgi:predicted TIM-barrel enzyme
MLHDDLAEDFAGVDIFQPDIGVDGGLHVAVAEKLSDQLILTRTALENESACGVSELVHRHPQSGRLINPLRDLAAEQNAAFGASALPREQPVIVPAT